MSETKSDFKEFREFRFKRPCGLEYKGVVDTYWQRMTEHTFFGLCPHDLRRVADVLEGKKDKGMEG